MQRTSKYFAFDCGKQAAFSNPGVSADVAANSLANTVYDPANPVFRSARSRWINAFVRGYNFAVEYNAK